MKGTLIFTNCPNSLPENPPDCPILCNWVFDNVLLAVKSFAKALWSLKTCVLVNNNLSKKLFLSFESSTTFDENFKVTSVPFFIQDFNLFIKLRIRQFYV